MAGIKNSVLVGKNADFSQANAPNSSSSENNGLITNGQLWIGTTALNAGGTHINVGALTSPDASITFSYSSPNITAVVTGGSTVGKTITGNDGVALHPTAGNWNILGLSGSKTSGAGSTLTIKSPPYANQAGSTTVTLNSGSFATGAITLTLPLSAGLADGDLVEFVATNGVLVVQCSGTQVAHIGAGVTTAGGTLTGSATGDSLSLRYQASTDDWWATSAVGVWTPA